VALGRRSSTRTTQIARTQPGVPELYARPIAADVNGDGVEDMVLVASIDRGPRSSGDGEDTWGKIHGRFEPFVQAIDGRDGRVLYAIKLGEPYTSLGDEAKTAERVVLVADKDRLGVARVRVTGPSKLGIYNLATGEAVTELSFAASTGRACENVASPKLKGTFFLEGQGTAPGTTVDLHRATATSTPSSACGAVATPSVADVPVAEVNDRTPWDTRFSHELKLRGDGPYAGRIVVQAAGLGVLVSEANGRDGSAENHPTSDGGRPPGGERDDVEIVGLDLAAGATRFTRSLASLGLKSQVVDHIEGTSAGALLFFEGAGGLALLDVHGEKKWALPLPKGHRISSYTLSKTRAYLHVLVDAPETYGVLSKKLGSRILVVDLDAGRYVRSIPDGALG
jgi:hypothetical protein